MITEIVLGVIAGVVIKKKVGSAIAESKAKPRKSPIAEDPSVVERYKEYYGIDPTEVPEVEGETVE